jgi:calmodulin
MKFSAPAISIVAACLAFQLFESSMAFVSNVPRLAGSFLESRQFPHQKSLLLKDSKITFENPTNIYMSTITEDDGVQITGDFEPDKNGIYTLLNAEHHAALIDTYPDKIIVLKFYAPWCRACKGLEPKYVQIAKDPKYADLPIIFSQMSVQGNKDYIKSLGVVALPSVLIYAGVEGLVENFPCGPSKVPILKKKLANVVNTKVDPDTLQLMVNPPCSDVDCASTEETEPCQERQITGEGQETKLTTVGDVIVSDETMSYLRNEIPFFKDFNTAEFDDLMKKAKYVTFEEGSIIMKQGQPGRTFYIIDSGEVEISVKSAFEDPLTTPPSYLGAVINVLKRLDYFGERSIITNQPRAASIRANEKTRCFAFDKDDIPTSSVLSGKRAATTERIAQVDDKYGVDYYDVDLISSQFSQANAANQARGSVNKPGVIRGVDTDEDDIEVPVVEVVKPHVGQVEVTGKDDMIISLLVRFKLLRHAARCFDYITHTSLVFDQEDTLRRSHLVSKLTQAQRDEFTEVFKLIDHSGDGKISVAELKRMLESVGEEHSETELRDMINKADPSIDGNEGISLNDFLGVMAEADFYYLFKETFDALDTTNSGYVRAGTLDKVLCGMRDLISDDRKSIIDVEDKDMLIDTESFSLMLLGSHK